jgi:hypothetical protein
VEDAGTGGQSPFDEEAAEMITLPARASGFVFSVMLWQGCNDGGTCNHGNKRQGNQEIVH